MAAVKSAADQGEAINKSNVIFEGAARQISAWSKTTANSFGLTRSEALEAAGGFGAMLSTAGVAQKRLVPMSTQLVELASDMASFNNQDPSEMLERLRSGLAGEAEPLRRFGVFISEAAIQTQAIKDGLIKEGQAMTEQQKVQARFNLILSQTKKQQGDFARTQNQLPNLMRRVRAMVIDMAAAFGTVLLPIAKNVAQRVLALTRRFQELSPATRKTIIKIAGLAAVVGPAAFVVGKLIVTTINVTRAIRNFQLATKLGTAAVRIFNAIVGINPYILLIAATIAIVVLIIKNWSTIKRFLSGVWNWIKSTAGAIWNGLKSATSAVVGFVMDKINAIKNAIGGAISAVGDLINKIPGVGFVKDLVGLAHGGPVTAGRPVIVGERGPELFVPRQSGNIVPNAGVTINIQNAFGFDDFERKVTFAMGRAMKRAGAA